MSKNTVLIFMLSFIGILLVSMYVIKDQSEKQKEYLQSCPSDTVEIVKFLYCNEDEVECFEMPESK